jgi:CRP/FNR family transcriptional regulator
MGATAFDSSKRPMAARAAVGLMRLAEHLGRRRKDGIHLELKMSRQQLGAFLGLSGHNVSRALVDLQKRKVIVVNKTHIVITDPEGLAAIAEVSPK